MSQLVRKTPAAKDKRAMVEVFTFLATFEWWHAGVRLEFI
jgi:hypothetical protein